MCYFDRHFSSIWREQLAHGESTECPSTAFYPLCRSKAAVDVEWIEGCFDKEVSSFVYRRRTGLSKVTFLKVGWVKISKFLPRDLTQGELGKNRTHWCAPGSLGWLWDWNFGSGPEISLCGLYTNHAYSEFFAFHKFFALQRGHRTPQLGTYTYCKIHALCKIFALHKIFVLGDFLFFSVFFYFVCVCFFFSFFFWAKIAWNHVFWNMGKVAVSRETSVVSHTIAFQAILAKNDQN